MTTQNVILGSKNIGKQDTQNSNHNYEITNYVEISTSQSGKALVTVGLNSNIMALDDLILEATKSYKSAIQILGKDFRVANEPDMKVEIITSAKGFPQVVVSGEEKTGIKEHNIANHYSSIVKALQPHAVEKITAE